MEIVHGLSRARRTIRCLTPALLVAATACQGPALQNEGATAESASYFGSTALSRKKILVAVSPELRLAHLRARQVNAGPEYAIARVAKETASHELEGTCPRHGLRLRLGRRGLEIGPQRAEGAWRFNLRLVGYGSAGHVHPVDEAAPLVSGNRVEYRRGTNAGSLTEWYVNGPAGIEQGFTALSSPASPREGLVLELALEGNLQPVPSEDGQSIALRTASGELVLAYHDLFVEDATGRRLPARMEVDDKKVSLRVDDQAAVYPVTVDPWMQQQKLSGEDWGELASFGGAVAVSGDTALVGAGGSAYVFVRDGATWVEQQKLTLGDGPFAYMSHGAVALSGDTALIGAGGAGHVFVRSGTTWSLQQRLIGADGTALIGPVALSGDTALIGGAGESAYVFVRNGTMWSEQQKLTASDGVGGGGFGTSVALEGDTALVGAVANHDAVGANDATYVFVRNGSTWSEQLKLTPSDIAPVVRFGSSVALAGDMAFVGAPGSSIPAYGSYPLYLPYIRGSVYVFARSGTTWSQQQKLTPSDGAGYGFFGSSVAAMGNTALVGTFMFLEAYSGSGAAYLFARRGNTWSEEQKLTASDSGAGDCFGNAVALSSDAALIGAGGFNCREGAAYVFALEGLPAAVSCVSPEDCIGGNCVDGYCCDTPCGGGIDPCQVCSRAKGASANGVCTIPAGRSCDDGIACTRDDLCDASGTCAGTVYSCTPGQCEVTSICNGTGCTSTHKAAGTKCFDGIVYTKDDVCDGFGDCAGTPYGCTPGQCEGTSTCNGSSCTATYKPADTSCDDGDPCTKDDVCDGFGTCAGVAFSCVPGQCEGTSTCNGSSCTATYKPVDTSCDDGNPCTKNDLCDGLGACVGRAFTCAPGPCEVSSSCNGAGCTVTPKPSGASCPGGTCRAGACVAAVDGSASKHDAGGAQDAGADPEAGTSKLDGPSGADTGNPPGSSAQGGCSCRVGDSAGGLNGLFLLPLLAALGLRSRRARRRTRASLPARSEPT